MYMHGYMHGGPPHEGSMHFLFLFGLSRLLWLAILILLVCLLVRKLSRRRYWMHRWGPMGPGGPPPWQGANVPRPPFSGPDASHEQPSALEILNRRYASGEIDAQTFEHMRERILASQRPNQE